MTPSLTADLLLAAIPVLGTALSLLAWSKPRELKICLLLVTTASLGAIGWTAGRLPAQSAGAPLLVLLPAAALLSLLGQPVHRDNRAAWLWTTVLLGPGLGVLAGGAPLSRLFLFAVLVLTAALLFHFRRHAAPGSLWGAGTLGLGSLCAVATLAAAPPLASSMLLLTGAMLLPLVPFHKGYVAALTGLPGNLPAFLSVLLPVLGFAQISTLLPDIPPPMGGAMTALALAGTVYGALKALTQPRVASLLACGSLSFLSILWWYLLTARTVVPQAVVYVSAVALATCGLLLAWYALRARFGDVDARALTGLARSMPRLAVTLSLLAFAALGLPPFGVFSGFLGMLLAPGFVFSGGLIVIVVAWLSASWYLFDLAQRLLFGRERTDLRQEDLRDPELASLAVVLVLLAALGLMPSRWLDSAPAPRQSTVVTEVPAWNN